MSLECEGTLVRVKVRNLPRVPTTLSAGPVDLTSTLAIGDLTVQHFELQIMVAATLAAGSLTPNTDARTAVERLRLFLNEVKKHSNLNEIPPPIQ